MAGNGGSAGEGFTADPPCRLPDGDNRDGQIREPCAAPGRCQTKTIRNKKPAQIRELLHELLSSANREESRSEILRRICSILIRFSGCDALVLQTEENGVSTRCRTMLSGDGSEGFETVCCPAGSRKCGDSGPDAWERAGLLPEPVLEAILRGSFVAPGESFTRSGSFWIGDTTHPILLRPEGGKESSGQSVIIGGQFASLALIPIPVNERLRVILFLASRRPDFFTRDDVLMLEAVADTLGVALAHQGVQWALRERIKELTCLYGIAKVASRPGMSTEQFLGEIVELLPPGWQHPSLTQARITLYGRTFMTPAFLESPFRQRSSILIRGIKRGEVEVNYIRELPEADEGPFLNEERSLIDEVARQVGLIIERWESEEETNRLQEQLRHADRLATVGQLAAGVAHELNEPLGAILGFAQLWKEALGPGAPVAQDVDRIINASLHAREIIRKLMIFTRQMPTKRAPCDLNRVVGDSLYLLESRCAKEGITLERRLEEGLPEISADPSQLQQVLVNLVVNAIQAMPSGGAVTIRTRSSPDKVFLAVEDTGVGMSQETQQQLFMPFFTLKEVGQGTGLGLPVVHGIVTAHGGAIEVRSESGMGSSFEISFPREGEGPSTPGG